MFPFYVVMDGFCGNNFAVGAKHKIYKTFKQSFFADFMAVHQVVYYNGIVQVFQVSALCVRAVKFKTFWESTPDQVIRNGNILAKFFCIF